MFAKMKVPFGERCEKMREIDNARVREKQNIMREKKTDKERERERESNSKKEGQKERQKE